MSLATDQFAANTGVEFFDGTFVRVCCHGTVRGSVRSTIKGVDRLRQAELGRRHGCAHAQVKGWVRSARNAQWPEAGGRLAKHTAHGIQVCLSVLLKDTAFLFESNFHGC